MNFYNRYRIWIAAVMFFATVASVSMIYLAPVQKPFMAIPVSKVALAKIPNFSFHQRLSEELHCLLTTRQMAAFIP